MKNRNSQNYYCLDVFRDRNCTNRVERLSLSAESDGQAVRQADAVRWRSENCGESRIFVLLRPTAEGWKEIARIGSRRYRDEESAC